MRRNPQPQGPDSGPEDSHSGDFAELALLGFVPRPRQDEASDTTQLLEQKEFSRWLIHAGVLLGLWEHPGNLQEGFRLLEQNGLAPEAWQYPDHDRQDPKKGVARGEFTRAVVALVSLKSR